VSFSRRLILPSQLCFSQLLVNEVLSTDISDKELKALRNARWDKAFKELDADRNRRATIVIEHLIQVSRARIRFAITQKFPR
jgi:hypothetical protein